MTPIQILPRGITLLKYYSPLEVHSSALDQRGIIFKVIGGKPKKEHVNKR